MIRKLVFIDAALLALVVFLAYQLRANIKKFQEQSDLSKIKAKAQIRKETSRKSEAIKVAARISQIKDKGTKLELELNELRKKPGKETTHAQRDALQKEIAKKSAEIHANKQELEKLQAESGSKPEPGHETRIASQSNALVDYQVIVDKYLFSEERTMPKGEPVVEKLPELTPKPVLTGIVLEGNNSSAIIEEAGGPAKPVAPGPVKPGGVGPVQPGTRKVTKILRLGDDYQGYKVTSISGNQVVLSYGNGKRTETLVLFDKSKPRAQVVTGMTPTPPPASAAVISVGATPSQPTPPGSVAQPGVPHPTGPLGTAPGTQPVRPPRQRGQQPNVPQPGGVTQPQPGVAPPHPNATPQQGTTPPRVPPRSNSDNRVRTPFGNIPKE